MCCIDIFVIYGVLGSWSYSFVHQLLKNNRMMDSKLGFYLLNESCNKLPLRKFPFKIITIIRCKTLRQSPITSCSSCMITNKVFEFQLKGKATHSENLILEKLTNLKKKMKIKIWFTEKKLKKKLYVFLKIYIFYSCATKFSCDAYGIWRLRISHLLEKAWTEKDDGEVDQTTRRKEARDLKET